MVVRYCVRTEQVSRDYKKPKNIKAPGKDQIDAGMLEKDTQN